MDCSPPGSSVHGILQVRKLERVAIPFSRGSSQPRDRTRVSCTAGGFSTLWATREAYRDFRKLPKCRCSIVKSTGLSEQSVLLGGSYPTNTTKALLPFPPILPKFQIIRPGVPNLQDLMPDDLWWSWCNNNKVHSKCNVLESSPNHPQNHPQITTTCPSPICGKSVFH